MDTLSLTKDPLAWKNALACRRQCQRCPVSLAVELQAGFCLLAPHQSCRVIIGHTWQPWLQRCLSGGLRQVGYERESGAYFTMRYKQG